MSTTKKKRVIGKYIPNENDDTSGYLGYPMSHIFVKKAWGNEIWFANNDLYCGKQLHLKRFSRSSRGNFHYHKIKDETFYVIDGVMTLYIIDPDGGFERKYKLKKGDSFRVKPMVPHRFTTGWKPCTFIEVSTHHEDSDSYYGV